MTAYANVNGETCLEVSWHVPNVGPWWADVVFELQPNLPSAVVLALGDLRLLGTVAEIENGTFGTQRRSRVVAGAGGWSILVTPQHYHNDAGVRALAVAQDAARLAGETLGDFAPAADTIGNDYVRRAGPASRVLEDVIGSVPWWVDYDGDTIVGARATEEAAPDDYQVLDFDPRENLVTLAIDDLSAVGIGSILSEGLDAPVTIFELEIMVSAQESRTIAWVGGTAGGRSRITELFRGIARRTTDTADRLYAKYRYRVVRMSGSKVELQAVSQAAGLPDLIPVSQRPGVAGAHSKLPGAMRVIVEFIEGDPTMPIVTAYEGKDGSGHETDELDLSVATTLRLGSDGASEGVTLGDSHKTWADAHTHAYIPGTNPAALTTPPASDSAGTPDPSPATSTKVKVE